MSEICLIYLVKKKGREMNFKLDLNKIYKVIDILCLKCLMVYPMPLELFFELSQGKPIARFKCNCGNEIVVSLCINLN